MRKCRCAEVGLFDYERLNKHFEMKLKKESRETWWLLEQEKNFLNLFIYVIYKRIKKIKSSIKRFFK